MLSGLIVIFCMTISIVLRLLIIKSTINKPTDLETQTGQTIYNSFAVAHLNFEYYLLGGLILGCIVSFLSFRDKELKSFFNIRLSKVN